MASDSVTPTGPPKKILSLDGGGVKGVSTLLILQAILKDVALIEDGPTNKTQQAKSGIIVTAESSSSSQPERKPVDYFDLIAGTSTGGIIALQLGRLSLTCQQSLCLYDELAQNIFAIRALGINFSKSKLLGFLGPLVLKIKLLFGSQFSAKYVDEAMDQLLLSHGLCSDEKLVSDVYNPPDAPGKILMCATMVNAGKALLFRNYTPPADAVPETDPPNDRTTAPLAAPYHPGQPGHTDTPEAVLQKFDYNCVEIRQAIRATSAAPTYLPPEQIQCVTFWDGGLLNNNPIDEAWSARFDLASSQTAEPLISSILSIGTGMNSPQKPKTGLIGRLLGILNETINFATNVEAKHWDFKRDVFRRNLRLPKDLRTDYFRFDVPLGNTIIDLADYKAMPKLAEMTRRWLEREDVKREIHCCALTLAKRKWSDSQA